MPGFEAVGLDTPDGAVALVFATGFAGGPCECPEWVRSAPGEPGGATPGMSEHAASASVGGRIRKRSAFIGSDLVGW